MTDLLKQLLVADWIAKSFPVIRVVFMALIVLCAVAIIVCILRMESNPEGGRNVISGSSESFYMQNQSSTREGRLKKIVIISSIILIVVTILFFISCNIYLPESV